MSAQKPLEYLTREQIDKVCLGSFELRYDRSLIAQPVSQGRVRFATSRTACCALGNNAELTRIR